MGKCSWCWNTKYEYCSWKENTPDYHGHGKKCVVNLGRQRCCSCFEKQVTISGTGNKEQESGEWGISLEVRVAREKRKVSFLQPLLTHERWSHKCQHITSVEQQRHSICNIFTQCTKCPGCMAFLEPPGPARWTALMQPPCPVHEGHQGLKVPTKLWPILSDASTWGSWQHINIILFTCCPPHSILGGPNYHVKR